jgi:four helix bundle protein
MNERIRYHTDLRVWQRSRSLAVSVYRATADFPRAELFSLTDQVRRACGSVPANIAEGCGRGTTQELIRSLRVARGSLSELHSHLTLAQDLGYIQAASHAELTRDVMEVHRMLNALIASLRRRSNRLVREN